MLSLHLIMDLYFAPFHGITNQHFRNVFFSHFHGIDTVLSPFLPAGNITVLSKARFADVFPPENEPLPLIVQIIGTKKQEITDTVKFLYDQGYERINWNIGCPMPQIVRKHRGCGFMPYAKEIEDTTASVLVNTSAKFSIKMRLGMYKKEESLEILQRLNNYPLDFITIHARLGIQLYSGKVDINAFANCLETSVNTLCYNGDMKTIHDFNSLQALFPNLNLYMLGRGMLQNPFLAEQIKNNTITISRQKERFSYFHHDLINSYLEVYRKSGVLNRMKELWHYFAVFFTLSDTQSKYLFRISDLSEFEKRTKEIMING